MVKNRSAGLKVGSRDSKGSARSYLVFESCRVRKPALLLLCEGILDSGCAQQLVHFHCTPGVAEAGAQPLGHLESRAGALPCWVQEAPAPWLQRRCCRAVVPGLCSVGQGWVSVPAQELLSGELWQCAHSRCSGAAGRSRLPMGLRLLCAVPCGRAKAGKAGQPATTSPCPCTVPTAAPDCARQNCRCQALHRKESGEGGRGGGTSAQQQGCEVQINLVLCWCRSEAPRPPAPCGPTVTHTGLCGAAGPAAGHPSPVLLGWGTAGAQGSVGPRHCR